MKKFMKKLAKKAEGFTLVELVVVIAILGILAGVAVPAYNGYLTKAKTAADITTLDAVLTAAQASHAKEGSVTYVKVTETVTGTGAAAAKVETSTTSTTSGTDIATTKDFRLYFTGSDSTVPVIDLKTGSSAVWTGSDWTIS